MSTRSFLLTVLIILTCTSLSAVSGAGQKASRLQTTAQLVAMQPPPMREGPDKFAIDVNCSFWKADQAALDECSKDLDLIKELGVGTVRLSFSWAFLSEASALDPKKLSFAKTLLNAARVRGIKILFQVGMYAPVGAYQCQGVQNPPTTPSPRLDFCDEAFASYLSALMEVVLPFTADIELFNETNWGFSPTDPSYNADNGTYGYIPRRENALYVLARQVLDAEKKRGYKAVLHSQGISYFCNSDFPDEGWKPPAGSALVQATDDIQAMGNYSTSATSPLNSAVDIVDIHPYFNSSGYLKMMYSFIDTLAKLTPGGRKPLWITETNNGIGRSDADETAVFDQVKLLMDTGQIQKAFWYVIRNGDKGNGEGDDYSIYAYNREVIRPQLAAAIKAYSESIPVSERFLSGPYLTPIQ